MAGKKGMKHYPVETKVEAVRLYEQEGKSCHEIADLLEIRSHKRVEKWMKDYREKGAAFFERDVGQTRRGRPPKRENVEAYIARLEMENDLLKKFHAELRKEELARRNIGLSTTRRKSTK